MVRQAHHDAVESVTLSLYRVTLSLTKGESKSSAMVRQAHHDAVEGVTLSFYRVTLSLHRVTLSLTKGERN
jgi:hypothetical protein